MKIEDLDQTVTIGVDDALIILAALRKAQEHAKPEHVVTLASVRARLLVETTLAVNG